MLEPHHIERPGKNFRQDLCCRHAAQCGHGVFRFQQPQHFPADALARQLRKSRFPGGSGVQRCGIQIALAIPGVKAKQPQNAQIILADARRRHERGISIRTAGNVDKASGHADGDLIERLNLE